MKNPNRELLEKKCERARVKLDLTPEQVKLLQREARALYEEISYDLYPDNKKSRTCRRSTVIEVVCDASRLEQLVRRALELPCFPMRNEDDSGKDNPLIKACRDYERIADLIGPAFPYAEYEAGPYEDELSPM